MTSPGWSQVRDELHDRMHGATDCPGATVPSTCREYKTACGLATWFLSGEVLLTPRPDPAAKSTCRADVDSRTAGGLVPADDSDLLPNAAGDQERERRRLARTAYRRGTTATSLAANVTHLRKQAIMYVQTARRLRQQGDDHTAFVADAQATVLLDAADQLERRKHDAD